MNTDYRISNDGTIFEIKEDGSISKIARIDEHGNVSSISGTINRQTKSGKGKYWFFIVLFFIISALLGVLYLDTLDNLSYYKREYKDKNNELSEIKSIVSHVSKTHPLIVTDIKIGNTYYNGTVQTEFGDRIYDYNTMYLTPKISYVGLVSGTKELKVKWYHPNGILSRGDSTLDDFSQTGNEYNINKGSNVLTLLGWGNENKGHWSRGIYRIEIWYLNTCLKAQTFEIY